MTNSLIMGYSGGDGTVSTSNPEFWCFTGTAIDINAIWGNNNESAAQITFRTAGQMSKLFCRVTTGTTSGSSTVRLRQNSANGNETFSIAQATTGTFSDNSNNDNISAGDKLCISVTHGDTNLVINIMAATFAPTTASTSLSKCGTTFIATGSTGAVFPPPMGCSSVAITEANAKLRMRKSFTAKNCCVNVITASSTTTITSRKNGANGAIAVSCTASTTGIFEDVSHSDSLVSGDDYNFTYTGDNTFTPVIISIELTNSNGDVVLAGALDTLKSLNTSTTAYGGLGGQIFADSSETVAQVTVNSVYTFSQLAINITSNNITSSPSATINLRANGGNTGVVVSAINSQTGVLVDNTHSYTSLTTDAMNYQVVTGTAGNSLSSSFVEVNLNNASTSTTGLSYYAFDNTPKAVDRRQVYNSFSSQFQLFG